PPAPPAGLACGNGGIFRQWIIGVCHRRAATMRTLATTSGQRDRAHDQHSRKNPHRPQFHWSNIPSPQWQESGLNFSTNSEKLAIDVTRWLEICFPSGG